MLTKEKKNIIRDFEIKKYDYYTNAYVKKNMGNYIRRLRNELIVKITYDIEIFDNVLDVGCGPEILYKNLLRRAQTYVAMDLVESNIDVITEKYKKKNIKCVVGDIDYFSVELGGFDIIICSGSLEYSEKPLDNLQKLIRGVASGGCLIASFPNLWSPYRLWGEYVYNHLSYLRKRMLGRRTFPYSRRLMQASKVRRLCQDMAGVRAVEIRHFGYRLILQPLDRLFVGLDHKIARRLQQKPIGWLRFCATEFLVIVRK